MAKWWDEDAKKIADTVLENERDWGLDDYSKEEIQNAIIRIRADIILVVSHLSSANYQLESIRRLVFYILFVLIVIAVLLFL
tara:strand:- start:322 stop:567 length:246 start_codon:yes stop_codon:yes gene_type:complete